MSFLSSSLEYKCNNTMAIARVVDVANQNVLKSGSRVVTVPRQPCIVIIRALHILIRYSRVPGTR